VVAEASKKSGSFAGLKLTNNSGIALFKSILKDHFKKNPF
jgi:hypothetical protein